MYKFESGFLICMFLQILQVSVIKKKKKDLQVFAKKQLPRVYDNHFFPQEGSEICFPKKIMTFES